MHIKTKIRELIKCFSLVLSIHKILQIINISHIYVRNFSNLYFKNRSKDDLVKMSVVLDENYF